MIFLNDEYFIDAEKILFNYIRWTTLKEYVILQLKSHLFWDFSVQKVLRLLNYEVHSFKIGICKNNPHKILDRICRNRRILLLYGRELLISSKGPSS